MNSSVSLPSIPVTGILIDPSLSKRLRIKTKSGDTDTLIRTAVGILRDKVAEHVSETFKLPAIEIEEEGTMTIPTVDLSHSLSTVGPDGLTILFQPAQPSVSNHISKLLGELGESNKRLEEANKRLEEANKRQEEKLEEMSQQLGALDQMTCLITPIHLRVLLDQARDKIVKLMNLNCWDDLCRDNKRLKSARLMTNEICNSVSAEHLPPRKTVHFLCSYNNIRHTCNSITHNAKPEEIKAAILRNCFSSEEQNSLEQLFLFTHKQSI